MSFDKRTLVYPPETRFGERTIVAPGDVILADGVRLEMGVETPGRVFLGERVELEGNVHAAGDVRADTFSRVSGDVVTAASAYLGERVRVGGRLSVEGDLDVGNDVKIEQGFEAHGWINIRNPIPVVVYMFIYLLQLMQMGRSEEVERILQELEEDGAAATFAVSANFLYVPDGSRVALTESVVKGRLQIGRASVILGNHEVAGGAVVGALAKLHGALRAGGDVQLEEGAEVVGELTARGAVELGPNTRVGGRVEATRLVMHPTARVEGEIVAPQGVRILTPALVSMKEKVEAFETTKTPDVEALL